MKKIQPKHSWTFTDLMSKSVCTNVLDQGHSQVKFMILIYWTTEKSKYHKKLVESPNEFLILFPEDLGEALRSHPVSLTHSIRLGENSVMDFA